MRRRRRRLVAAGTASALAGAGGLIALPSASAQLCTVTVKLVDGTPLNFTVDVPPGTPLSDLSLPITGAVLSESESCAAPTPPAGTTTTTTTPAPAPSTTPATTTAPPSAPALAGRPQPQLPSVNKSVAPAPLAVPAKPTKPAAKKPAPKPKGPATAGHQLPLRAATGIPALTNPTFSFSLPTPAPLGVPDFFIEKFQIPPFMLPIYQAAGIEYDVPWQVLAAINEVETDYGRNLSVSTAGAEGWMQFLPSTFKQYGVDANGDGVADPYNPEDAVFTAARYLQAAGAAKNLRGAVFAYNHADWYVNSVLLRAKLIGGMPAALIGALSGLVEGYFPVAAPAKYADDSVEKVATRRIRATNPAVSVESDPHSRGVNIFAAHGSPVIAVSDGKIVGVGQSAALGRYIQLQDATGNVYTYSHLGSVPSSYAVPKPVHVTAADISRDLASTPPPVPARAATAGLQDLPPLGGLRAAAATVTHALTGPTPAAPTPTPAAASAAAPSPAAASAGAQAAGSGSQVKERLFGHPNRAAAYQAGGAQQAASEAGVIASFRTYFTSTLHLARSQYTLAPLKKGAIVVAGTVLGHIGPDVLGGLASHVRFSIRPAGRRAPEIDPKPILDGWKLLQATAVYRANNRSALLGANASIGQVLLMSKDQLQQRILQDPHVKIYACGRRDIAAGSVDRRILAGLEFLAGNGLDPTVSGLVCGHALPGSAAATDLSGASVEIDQINGIPIQGHQGTGSIADITIRRLETLQGALKPDQIISLMSYKGQTNTLALPDHADRLQVTYTPLFGQNKKLTAEVESALKPTQWIDLIKRLGQIQNPSVSSTPSAAAVKVNP